MKAAGGPGVISDLATIIDTLDAQGRLVRVRSQVDPKLGLAGVAAKFEGQNCAVLFENVKGYEHPVFMGLYWSRQMLGGLFGRDEHALPQHVSNCISQWQTAPVAPVVVKNGPVLEVTQRRVNIKKLPIPVHATGDAGPYLDAAVVITKDPETGVRNTSIQRFLVVNATTLAVNIDAGRHLETYLAKAEKLGRPLALTINIGVGPGLHFAAATPAEAAPIHTDELGIASAFHDAPVELVAGTVSDVEMVANAMYALECEITPGETLPEGPFAEVTGYYATRAPRPKVKIRKIHHRQNPVFHSILSGKEVFNSVGLLGEANVLNSLRQQIPGVRDVYFSHGGCGFYHAVVQISQMRAGWSKQALMATFAAFAPLKMVTVVDDDVDIRNPSDVEWAMTTRLDGATGILKIENVFGHGLNPTFPDYIGTKIGFDATRPFPFTENFDRAKVKDVDMAGVEYSLGGKAAKKPPRKTKSPR